MGMPCSAGFRSFDHDLRRPVARRYRDTHHVVQAGQRGKLRRTRRSVRKKAQRRVPKRHRRYCYVEELLEHLLPEIYKLEHDLMHLQKTNNDPQDRFYPIGDDHWHAREPKFQRDGS